MNLELPKLFRARVWLIVAVLVLLPMLYVGSLGPLIWLDRQINFPGSVVRVIDSAYWPVIWMQETSGPHRRVLDRYFDRFSS